MSKALMLDELENADMIWRGTGTAKWKPKLPSRPPRMSRRRLAAWAAQTGCAVPKPRAAHN